MALVAGFLWKKNTHSVSTLIFDNQTMELVLKPQQQLLPYSYFKFRREANRTIKLFFKEILFYAKKDQLAVQIEFKIVFQAHDIPYLVPAKESRYVYKIFLYWYKKTKKHLKNIKLKPQLRKKLSGRSLKIFNRELRKLQLVSGKQHTRYEYNLWAVALHATAKTYEKTLKEIKNKMVNIYWEKNI